MARGQGNRQLRHRRDRSRCRDNMAVGERLVMNIVEVRKEQASWWGIFKSMEWFVIFRLSMHR